MRLTSRRGCFKGLRHGKWDFDMEAFALLYVLTTVSLVGEHHKAVVHACPKAFPSLKHVGRMVEKAPVALVSEPEPEEACV